jgi:hypothetical protein
MPLGLIRILSRFATYFKQSAGGTVEKNYAAMG